MVRTTSATVTLLLALIICSCGDNDMPITPAGNTLVNNLIFERIDGSIVEFDVDVFVWCGAWEDQNVLVQSLQIAARTRDPEAGPVRSWALRAVLSDVTVGTPLEFPNSFIWNEPKNADLFILDESNELSTHGEASSGSITFGTLECDSEGMVDFTIDAIIASEFAGGTSLRIHGSFRAPISPQLSPARVDGKRD